MPAVQFTPWLKLLTTVFSTDVADSLRELLSIFQRIRYAPGLYEVLEHQVHLTLCDTQGTRASYSKQQRIRFLQDNVIAFQDTVWGDGDFLVNYRCSPGKAVDQYREGYRQRILISLRETKQRGAIEEFHIRREIHDGFLAEHEYLQADIDHRTRQLTVRVTFPAKRPPRKVWLTEANSHSTHALGSTSILTMPDERIQVVWRKSKPRLQERYILSWDW